MATTIEAASNLARLRGHWDVADNLSSEADVLRKRGLQSFEGAQLSAAPILDVESLTRGLRAELARQAMKYQEHGFPKALGISSDEFKGLVEDLAVVNPDAMERGFNIPAVVIAVSYTHLTLPTNREV